MGIVVNDCFDYAVLPRIAGESIRYDNPWYMDDDLYANEDYYTERRRREHASFDLINDSISLNDGSPFLAPEILCPGTVIEKIGATTGYYSWSPSGSPQRFVQ